MGAQAKSNSTASIAIYVILGLLLAFVVFYIVWKIMKKKLLKREDFAKSFADNKVYENFLEHATKIASYNCNLWESNIPETVQFFKDEYKLIPESEHKTGYLNLVEQSIRRQYYEKQQD